jgi:AcrR family transcriptional regulator
MAAATLRTALVVQWGNSVETGAMLQQSPRRGSETRERILELAEAAVLAKGFAATSIEELIAAVGITKSGFFYHFKDKPALAEALLLRYLDRDKALLDDLFGRADELNEDPLHGFLVALKFFAEMMATVVQPGNPPPQCRRHPGVAPPLPRASRQDRRALSAESAGRS